MSNPADNGWSRSSGSWLRLMEQGDPNRVLLLDEVMLGLCGEVRGLDVELIAEARRLQPGAVFHEAGAEALPLPDASVDLVVSYVSLVDIPDYRTAIREKARVLRPGGRLVAANLNSFSTASTLYWARDEDGHKRHWTMDNYMVERAVKAEWAGMNIVNWHRPLSAYMAAFMAAGLVLEHFDEPLPKREVITRHPKMQDFHRLPHFWTMVWRAPAG